MVKNKFMSPQQYVQQLSTFLQEIEGAGSHVAPFFEKLRTAIDDDKVADMDGVEFKEIAAEFDDVVEVYQALNTKMQQMKAPARYFGGHAKLSNIFAEYTAATEMMANALYVNQQAVNMDDFVKSEQDQDELIGKFYVQVQRMIGA